MRRLNRTFSPRSLKLKFGQTRHDYFMKHKFDRSEYQASCGRLAERREAIKYCYQLVTDGRDVECVVSATCKGQTKSARCTMRLNPADFKVGTVSRVSLNRRRASRSSV